jgi:hypothetical protein
VYRPPLNRERHASDVVRPSWPRARTGLAILAGVLALGSLSVAGAHWFSSALPVLSPAPVATEAVVTQPRRGVAAGAEGAARIDHDVDQPVLGVPPAGAHADSAGDLDRAMEVGTAVRPVIGDRGRRDVDEAPAGSRLDLAQLGDLAGRAVDRELDPARPSFLLEAVGRELQQVRHHRLRVFRSTANGEADHLR